MLQSKAGYIDARPLTASSAKPLAAPGRTIHRVRLASRATQSQLPLFPQQQTFLSPAVGVRKVPNHYIASEIDFATARAERMNRWASGKDRVLAAFGAWRFSWLDMPKLIEQSPDIFEFPLVDRDPVSTWTSGRVTLIGDAAHPMQPIGSQAGSQAILDARLLTAALIAISNPIEALQHYDATRRPVMNDITLRNRSFGPEAAMQLVEERAPNGFVRIEDVISRHELDSIANSFAVAAGPDVETVNNGLSFVRPS